MRDKKTIVLLVILAILVVIAGGVLIYKVKNSKKAEPTVEVNEPVDVAENSTLVVSKQNQIKIFNGTDRPIAVMIDNHSGAWPQANLNKAYLVYEIVVEGGETRLMALFKGQNLDKIGPVRSSRHYFLDYALENDAIYVHHGQSPQAQSDFSKLGIERVVVDNSKTGWRDTSLNVSSEHTLFTSIEKLNKGTNNFRKERNKNYLLNYSADEIDMSSLEKSSSANKISLVYSSGTKVYYEYDESNKYYLRSTEIGPHTDYVTKEQYHFKNIIAYQIDNYTINDGENKGRQDIKNIGSGSGYYFSDGYMIPIKWKKDSRSSQTKYTYEDGTELKVNDGNTFIQIVPSSGSIKAE